MGRLGDGDWRIVLRVDKTILPYLEERPWHATQRITGQSASAAIVELRLNNLIDIRRRVLACGSHVEVLEPADLREAVAAEAKWMAQTYANKETLACQTAESPANYSPGHTLSRPAL